MRPTFTTGTPNEYVRTIAICRMTRNFSLMLLAEKSSKLSAQSPAWSRKALPDATWASPVWSDRASPANTSGGKLRICFSARSRSASSGHGGCCLIGNERQLSGAQDFAMAGAYRSRKIETPTGFPVGVSLEGFGSDSEDPLGVVAETRDCPRHETAGGFGGDAEALADLAE